MPQTITNPTPVIDALIPEGAVEVNGVRLFKPTSLHNVVYDALKRKIPEEYRNSISEIYLLIQVYSNAKNELRTFTAEWKFETFFDYLSGFEASDFEKHVDAISRLTRNVDRLKEVAAGDTGAGADPTPATVAQ